MPAFIAFLEHFFYAQFLLKNSDNAKEFAFRWSDVWELRLFFSIYIIVHIKYITANWLNKLLKNLFCRHVSMLWCLRKHNEVNIVWFFNLNFSTLSLKHHNVFIFMLEETFYFLFSIFPCIFFLHCQWTIIWAYWEESS